MIARSTGALTLAALTLAALTLAALTLAALTLAGACGGPKPARPPTVASTDERFAGSLSPPPAEGAEVVAEVDGERVYAADVARHAAAHGLTPRQALEELIAAELLAGEARRRGLADAGDVVEVRRRERVRRLIDREFAAAFDGPEDVPAQEVERAWAHPDLQRYYNHPEIREVTIVTVKLERGATPLDDARAREVAAELRARATAGRPATEEDFLRIAGDVARARGRVFERLAIATTPRATPFSDAAFAIARPLGVSPPTRTPGGWSIVLLRSVTPARATTRAEAEPELRRQLFELSREGAFLRWADAAAARVRVRRSAAADRLLEAVEVDSPVGMP